MVLSKTIQHDSVEMDILVEYNSDINDVEFVHSIIVTDKSDNAEIEIGEILDAYFGAILKFLISTIDWEEQYKIALSELNLDL